MGLTREDHDRLLARELKKNPWKYTVRQVYIINTAGAVISLYCTEIHQVSTVELMIISFMILMPTLVYGFILINLPNSKYKIPLNT